MPPSDTNTDAEGVCELTGRDEGSVLNIEPSLEQMGSVAVMGCDTSCAFIFRARSRDSCGIMVNHRYIDVEKLREDLAWRISKWTGLYNAVGV
jgi:hypothetical protein